MKFKFLLFIFLLAFGISASAEDIYPTTSNEKLSPAKSNHIVDNSAIFSVSLENDFFANKDENYTNGFRISYLSPEADVPYWLETTANLFPFINTSGNKRWGFELGQNIFTPKDISINPPDPKDSPYAGWLYGSAILVSDNDKTLDTFVLTLGMVGPSSLAKEVQDTVHRWTSFQRPQGWDSQIRDEPGIVLSYDKKFRNVFEMSPFGLGFDITPNAGVNLGNIYTNANVGLMARLGQDLPSDYGPPLIRPAISGSDFFIPSKKFGWYLFAGVQGMAVARDIFLDGNNFRDSPSVDKKNFVGGLQTGIAFTFDDTRISYTQVFRTKEYDTQRTPDNYGAITVSFRF